ncbi:MAG: hypothetical protein Hyperionvirus6_102 [Hyperionvirus sp.]|uniref:Uncharacterized protein n=1 Tax=Hyperionvirus sp. TaxID=2487770 RepID=A0A3G5AB12_9VIRU|nr:MAG: hypothetical protein Hyperionvirus6_102 [Hyperionvirus sp.]
MKCKIDNYNECHTNIDELSSSYCSCQLNQVVETSLPCTMTYQYPSFYNNGELLQNVLVK